MICFSSLFLFLFTLTTSIGVANIAANKPAIEEALDIDIE
jgi:hypothetical protein